jgi:hypothetical protein
MAEPVADRDEVHAGLQQMDGGGVAQRVGVHTFSGEARHRDLRPACVRPEEVAHAEASEGLAPAITEESLRRFVGEPSLVDECT